MGMINRIKDRMDEPSTYAGLAAVAAGASQAIPGFSAGPVEQAASQAAEAAQGPGGMIGALVALAAGVAAMLRGEPGKKGAGDGE